MALNFFFALLGGLLVLAFVANRLVRITGVPDVIILMATGVLIGPVLHWVNPQVFRGVTQGFGSLALILILFEGGLELKIREIISHFAGGLFLAVFSYVLSCGGSRARLPPRASFRMDSRAPCRSGARLYKQLDHSSGAAASEATARSQSHVAGRSHVRRCTRRAGRHHSSRYRGRRQRFGKNHHVESFFQRDPGRRIGSSHRDPVVLSPAVSFRRTLLACADLWRCSSDLLRRSCAARK